MTYEQVVAIIGHPGEELSRGGKFDTVIYAWKNSDGSNMMAAFQNGKLQQKGQTDLTIQEEIDLPK